MLPVRSYERQWQLAIGNAICYFSYQQCENDVAGVPARVFTAEHLAAIALQTGRAKDKTRLLQFTEAGVLDLDRFQAIISRHGLQGAWQRFEKQFLGDNP